MNTPIAKINSYLKGGALFEIGGAGLTFAKSNGRPDSSYKRLQPKRLFWIAKYSDVGVSHILNA